MSPARRVTPAPIPGRKKSAAKVPAQSSSKPAESRLKKAKVVATPTAKAPAPVKPAKLAEKPRKPKMVRDSFTIPKVEFAVIDDLKQRAARTGRPAKKSELIRAGLKALAAMSDSALAAALKAVPLIKTGRPAKA